MATANHAGQQKNTTPTTLTRSVHKNLDSSGYGGGISRYSIGRRDQNPELKEQRNQTMLFVFGL
jgi:hypothetical protein